MRQRDAIEKPTRWTSTAVSCTPTQLSEGSIITNASCRPASKIFPGLDRSLTWKTFSDHHLNVSSRWSASPSKEVDHAWNELGVKDQFILVPGSIGRAHGLDPRKHVYAPESVAGPGKEGSGAFVQGLHDLHCLVRTVSNQRCTTTAAQELTLCLCVCVCVKK